MTSFLTALEFLTRLTLRRTPRGDVDAIARAQAWFPAIGLVIGGVLVGIDRGATRALPEGSVDVLLVVALALITGGLHLDGLADAADGLFGGYTRERRLEIMRDVHAGSFAVIAIVCVPHARDDGIGATQHERAGWPALALGAVTALAVSVALLGLGGLYVCAAAAAVALGMAWLSVRMVGGMTGDLYGATIEIAEVVLLLFIAAMANRGWMDAWLLG
jgi:adenosylcobinamide-GDP ribazoletransferase